MNSIRRKFRKTSRANPYWAAFVCFSEAIAGMGYNHKTIRRNFLWLVPKEDYEAEDEKQIVAGLDLLSKRRKDVQNSI